MLDELNVSNISIRGRVAISIRCLWIILEHLQHPTAKWKFLFEQLSKYTSTERLDDWHEVTTEYTPEVILGVESFELGEFEHISKQLFLSLQDIYKESDDLCRQAVESIYEVGTINLYGGLSDGGKSSSEALLLLLSLMRKNNIPTPSIDLYTVFAFQEERGWGKKFELLLL